MKFKEEIGIKVELKESVSYQRSITILRLGRGVREEGFRFAFQIVQLRSCPFYYRHYGSAHWVLLYSQQTFVFSTPTVFLDFLSTNSSHQRCKITGVSSSSTALSLLRSEPLLCDLARSWVRESEEKRNKCERERCVACLAPSRTRESKVKVQASRLHTRRSAKRCH